MGKCSPGLLFGETARMTTVTEVRVYLLAFCEIDASTE